MRRSKSIDIIFCIDGTGSMHPCFDSIRSYAKKFCRSFTERMADEHGVDIERLNVKVIVFRDFREDSDPMMFSEWFDLTAGDADLYEKFLDSIIVGGGGDLPENGLEALFYAMTSEWESQGRLDRQVIVLFTDADAKPIGESVTGINGYTVNMVDKAGLIDTWMGKAPSFIPESEFNLNQRAKRLVIYAPEGTMYQDLASELNNAMFVPTAMGTGLEDIDIIDTVKLIAFASV